MFRVLKCLLLTILVQGFVYEDDYNTRVWTVNSKDVFSKWIYIEKEKVLLDNLPKIYDQENGSILYTENVLIYNCHGPFLITEVFPSLKDNISVNHLSVEDCTLPTKPLVETFKDLNINVTRLKSFRISVTLFQTEPLPEGNYTNGLDIEELEINTPYVTKRDFLKYNPEFLEPLNHLEKLVLTGSVLPPLPSHINLKSLVVTKNTKVTTWVPYCNNLTNLVINNIDTDSIPNEWPETCSQLESLELGDLKEVYAWHIVSSGIYKSCANLQVLDFWSCNLTSLPIDILNNSASSLKVLNLRHNRLTDNDLLQFPQMNYLTELDLSRNRLAGWVLFEIARLVPSLRSLKVGENMFLNLFCNYGPRVNMFTFFLDSLQELWLDGMAMNTNCLKSARFRGLKYLNMANADEIELLQFQNLPRTKSPDLVVDLRNRTVKTIAFSEVDYKYLSKGESTTEGYEQRKHGVAIVVTLGVSGVDLKVDPKVSTYWNSNYNSERTRLTVLMDPIDCDCKHYWLARALRDLKNFVTLPGLRCNNTGVEVINEPLENLHCNKYHKLGCIQRQSEERDEKTGRSVETIECHNSQSENDEYPIYSSAFNIVSLNLSDNHMENLSKVRIMDSMKLVDLRRNRISRLNINDTSLLFNNTERKVWLSNNLFVCDCENALMLDKFHKHRDQIEDFNDIWCIDSELPMSSVTSYEACQYGLKIALSFIGIIGVLLIIAAIVLWRYRYKIKIYLYSKGWCLFCLSEEDVDSDRPYDAFLSFSHGDEQYVMEELLPKLEAEPYCYQICVHYRDWVIGDWIPKQIMRSVRLSKRTIIVLSKNFVVSLWGSLEFRYAVASAAQEGRSRLLVLVLDDVLSLDLDDELKGYLNYNTYLRCDDPWFWEKLRYTMPRQRKSAKENISQECHIDNNGFEATLMNDIVAAHQQ